MTPTLAAFLDRHCFPHNQLSAPRADRRFTLLMRACYHGSHAIMERLTAAGIDLQNGNGATCLIYVASNGKPDLVKLLLEKGANASLKNFDDFSALDLAASVDCLKLLRKEA